MQVITHTSPKMLIASEGKKIRDINDVYVAEYIDEEGNVVPEHEVYYSDFIFLADTVDVSKINELYIEE